MHMDSEYEQGEPTVLSERNGDPNGTITGHDNPPSLEQIEERLMYAARLGPGERFNVHINPLVAAAGDLLAQVVSVAGMGGVGDVKVLNEHLSEKIRTFEASAQHQGVSSEQMTAARYVLCTVLDETVLNTSWGGTSEWSRLSLLSRYHKETFGGEKFFQLLERLSANPGRHLWMLELMYLCLALGFEGKYRAARRGGGELDEIREALFRLIRHQRGDVPRQLSPQWKGADRPQRRVGRMAPGWQLALMTCLCLAALYSGFAWVLGEQRETVLQPYRQLLTAASEPRS